MSDDRTVLLSNHIRETAVTLAGVQARSNDDDKASGRAGGVVAIFVAMEWLASTLTHTRSSGRYSWCGYAWLPSGARSAPATIVLMNRSIPNQASAVRLEARRAALEFRRTWIATSASCAITANGVEAQILGTATSTHRADVSDGQTLPPRSWLGDRLGRAAEGEGEYLMIRKRTVLVLGAGASKPYGFPTGAELASEILLETSHEGPLFRELQGLGCESDEIRSFFNAFLDSTHFSLDAFVQQRIEFRHIAKLLIANRLAQHEDDEELLQKPLGDEDWYRSLFAKLFMRTNADEFRLNRLAV